MKKIYQLLIYLINVRLNKNQNTNSVYQNQVLEKDVQDKLKKIEDEVLSYASTLDIDANDSKKIQAVADYITAECDQVKTFVKKQIGGLLHQINTQESEQQTNVLHDHNAQDGEIKMRRIKQIDHELNTRHKLDFNPKIIKWVWLAVILLSIGDIIVFSRMYSNFSEDNNLQSLIMALSLGVAVVILAHFYPTIYRNIESRKRKYFVVISLSIITSLFYIFSIIRSGGNGTYEYFGIHTIFYTCISTFLFIASALVSYYLPSKEQKIKYAIYKTLRKEKTNLANDINVLELESKNMYLKQNSQKIDTLTKLSYQKSLLDSIDGAKESMIKKFAIHLTLFTKK